MNDLSLQLAVVLGLSSIFGFLVYKFKLPLLIGFLLVGVAISFVSFVDPHSEILFEVLPELGVAFVLFLIGMELDLREIRNLGKPILAATFGQLLLTTIAGFGVAQLLGFTQLESLLLGLGLSFSSTVVVVKLLSERNDLTSLYGKLSVGILLIEDAIALLLLLIISAGSSVFDVGLHQTIPVLTIILKGFGLLLFTFLASKFLLGFIFKKIAKSRELLFLTSISWCFLFIALSIVSGFSMVIGAFLAGVTLASTPYRVEIQGRIRPLRDFFLILFFVYLGSHAKIADILNAIPIIVIFTMFAIFVKPAIFLFVLRPFGFRKHTIFQTAINSSQVSEFSLKIFLVAAEVHLVSHESLSVMSAVVVLSILFSSALIAYSRKIYRFVLPSLSFFEHTRVHPVEVKHSDELNDHIVLIGAHRLGEPIVKFLKREETPFVVMEINPHIVDRLRDEGVRAIYGDVGDPDVLDSLQLEKARLIISSATDLADNESLLEECKRRKVKSKILIRVADKEQAKKLKEMGADYALLPEEIAGFYVINQLKRHSPNIEFTGFGINDK